MGFPTTASMNLGMLVGWGILSPISKAYSWAPGAVGDMSTGARGWILWTALAIMCSDALISLVPVMLEIVRKMVHGANPDEDSNENETPDRLVSIKWVLWGLGISIIVGTIIVWIVFGHEGIKPWATIIGFIMGTLLSILGCARYCHDVDAYSNPAAEYEHLEKRTSTPSVVWARSASSCSPSFNPAMLLRTSSQAVSPKQARNSTCTCVDIRDDTHADTELVISCRISRLATLYMRRRVHSFMASLLAAHYQSSSRPQRTTCTRAPTPYLVLLSLHQPHTCG